MKNTLLFSLLIIFTINTYAQDDWYVSPTGSSGNSGMTLADAWDLQTALNSPSVVPGDTILLAGGQYDGRYSSTISGNVANPITVRSVDGEWAVINANIPLGHINNNTTQGGLYLPPISGSNYVHFMDFEITSLETVQPLTRDGEDPNYIGITGINHVGGVDCKFINLVIHNMPGQGVGSWKPTGGTEFNGCIVYNNGTVDENDRQYEHGFYIQNNTDSTRKFKNNIVFNNFGKGMIFWSSSQCGEVDTENGDTVIDPNCDFLKNALFDNNAVFNNGNVAFVGQGGGRDNIEVATNDNTGGKIPRNVIIRNNALYHNIGLGSNAGGATAVNNSVGGSLSFGKAGANAVDNISVTNNLIMGRGNALRFLSAENLEFKNNDVFGRFVFINGSQTGNIQTDWDFDYNNYYTRFPSAFRFDASPDYEYWLDPSVCITPSVTPQGYWTDLGVGANSTWGYLTFFKGAVFGGCDPNDFPSRDSIKVTQNEYNPNRYTVVVVNPSNADNVVFDFSSSDFFEGSGATIEPNAQYTIRDVENYGTPISGSIDASYTVNFPMSLTAFEAPLKPLNMEGSLDDGTEKTPKNFGVFIIEFENICPTETTWTTSGWDNGAPDANLKAIIDAPYSALANGDFTACSLEITTNGNMIIEAGRTITVINNVTNNAAETDFVIKDDASLVMVVDTGFVTGRYTVEKEFSEFIENDPDRFQLWATPVEEAGSLIKDDIFSFQSVAFYFDASINAFDGISNGERLEPGKGYYIRQNDPDMSAREFTGTLNNGEVTATASIHPTDPALPSFNFYGNPYPSAIDWFTFAADNSAVLEGNTVYFWKQQNPSIAYQQQPPQWVVLNDTGSVPIGDNVTGTANKYISTAQGFTTEVIAAGEVVFKNSQRVAGNNDQFFRSSNTNDGKMWLNLKTSSTGFEQILLAFVDPVTSDAKYNNDGAGVEFYILENDTRLTISANEELSFQNTSIPLGFSATQPDTYSFNIEQEFISSDHNIILEDTVEGTFTDLRAEDYTFSVATSESSETRFILHFNYTDPTVISDFTFEKPCDSFGLDRDFTFTGGTEDATFLWDFGANAVPQTSTEENPQGIQFTEGDHAVTLTVSKNGTTDASTQTISTADIGSFGTKKVIVCHNGENVITVSLNALNTHLSHGDCIGPCDNSSSRLVSEPNKNTEEDILLFPNPTSGELNIKLNIDKEYNLLRLVDVYGRIVSENIIHETSMSLNVTNLSKGIYFLSVQLDEEPIRVKKFIIE